MTYVCSNISFDPQGYKAQLISGLVFIDLFTLIIGHTWDPTPQLRTIVNCRMIYLVCVITTNISMYVLWERVFKVPYIDMVYTV